MSAWIIYSIMVTSLGFCGLWSEKQPDGSYTILFTENEDTDESGHSGSHEAVYQDNLSKSEMKLILEECEVEANLFLRNYGSVFKLDLFPSFRNGKFLSQTLFCFAPLFVFTLMFKKVWKRITKH